VERSTRTGDPDVHGTMRADPFLSSELIPAQTCMWIKKFA
jgi:hypothetical protein